MEPPTHPEEVSSQRKGAPEAGRLGWAAARASVPTQAWPLARVSQGLSRPRAALLPESHPPSGGSPPWRNWELLILLGRVFKNP